MTPRFQDQTVLITGAGSGIGRACAQRFAAEGAFVMLVDRDEAALRATRGGLPEGAGAGLHALDIADEAAVNACVADIINQRGRIDVLCNKSLLMTRAVAPHMKACGAGAIVNTASVAGIRSGAGSNAYSASKAGVISLTQTAACDLGDDGIRVNAVCPGLTRTGMTKPVFDYAAEQNKEHKIGSRCELRRYGRPEEIAAAIAFFASDDASYIIGQALPVDGGNTASLNMPGMKV